ncbi:MAG: hypothetical protein ACI9BW_002193 [Gammaproteobacteria bacterium]|jgi:hypothetical protein
MASVEERLSAIEQDVHVLVAKDALRKVLSRYAVGVDSKRPEILRDLFHPQASLSVPNWNIDERGRDAVMAFFENYWSRFDNPRRYYANEEFTIAGSRAEAFMYWHVTQEREGDSVLGWGSYEWGFQLVEDNWLISKEVVHILAMTTLADGWAGSSTLSSL